MLLHAERIAFYCAADGELDPWPLLRRLPPRRRSWYLPVLRRHTPGRLWFVRWQPGERLRPNRFGILEPGRRGRRIRGARSLDLVLMPLVGFDAECNRIGMGAGYYDRSLAFLSGRGHWRKPTLIGLAHECQRVERIEQRPWDIPLDAVVSEQRIYRRGKAISVKSP
jgi:5-formyltetrahydrofolate cyclo-ligase